jgi:serine phosphatase RsbU (regulator of sigma subunit)/anti-sigma regulatory factor (Ser/Thr protein kinase)
MSIIVHRLATVGDREAVAEASAWANALAADFRLTHDETFRIDLCVTELVTNLLSYGSASGAMPHVELRAEIGNEMIRLEVRDDARPFNPLLMPPPAPLRSLADQRVGGFGIQLVRSFSDECHYERRGEENVFSFALRRVPAIDAGPRIPRGRDRRAVSDATAFPVERAGGERVRTEARSGVDRRTMGYISTFRIFRGVAYSDVEKIMARCVLRDFGDGEVLLRKGEFNSHVVLVIRGRLRIHLDAPDSRDFFEIGQGECVGEMSVIDGRPVSAYAVCDSGCRLLLIEASIFLSDVLIVPGVARNLMAVFSERMRVNNNRITERIKAAMELERLQRELHFARDIQEGMLPQSSPLFPERGDLYCGGRMRAAREVGGDFYDAFFIDADRLFLTIGDICGKGMPAALLMARTMTLLRSEATRRVRSQRQHIQDIMDRVNRRLCESNTTNYFSSIFVAIFSTSTRRLTYVNAGHNAPLLARRGSSFVFEPEPRNPVAGIAAEACYRAGEIAFLPGATLALYTDGVTEAENAQGEQFGEHRLVSTLNAPHSRDASSIIDNIFAAVDAFTTGYQQSDDITVLVLHFNG